MYKSGNIWVLLNEMCWISNPLNNYEKEGGREESNSG